VTELLPIVRRGTDIIIATVDESQRINLAISIVFL